MSLSFDKLFRIPDIRNKLLITLGLLFVYRIGFFIPLPGVNYQEFLSAVDSDSSGFGRVRDMMNILTGAKLQQASLFSLGVMPYISASIIFSLLVKVVPSLEKISKEGASGQKKINRYTRYATIPICLVQSFFVINGSLSGGDDGVRMLHAGIGDWMFIYSIGVMLALTTGTLFIMWLGEQITEHGAGNGISLIIMAGIVSSLPRSFSSMVATDGFSASVWQTLLLFLLTWFVAVVAVVYITKAQRRVPIRQAKLEARGGKRVYGGQAHFLPLKVNHAGVMPIIFASALLILPPILGDLLNVTFLQSFQTGTGFWYIALYAILIFFFSFFWTSLMFQPNEMADNLKEHGSTVMGIRPGTETAKFLESTMMRITLAGAAFLTLVAIFPSLVRGQFSGVDQTLIYFMSGTSILIVVGVALDLVDKLTAMVVMRNYEGIMKTEGGTQSTGWGRQK